MKTTKRILGIFLVAALMAGLLPPASPTPAFAAEAASAATTASAEHSGPAMRQSDVILNAQDAYVDAALESVDFADVMAWLESVEGTVYDFDEEFGSQAVDLIKGLYENVFGVPAVGGDAESYIYNELPPGFYRYAKEDIPGGLLRTGDIVIWGTEHGSGYGNVAVVIGINSDDSFIVMQANPNLKLPTNDTDPVARVTRNIHDYWGIISPPVIPAAIHRDMVFNAASGNTLTEQMVGDQLTAAGVRAGDTFTAAFGNSVASIGDRAFASRSGLTHFTIPDTITSIGSEAFRDCTSLTSVLIPASMANIGNEAFRYCSSLESAYFYGPTPSAFGADVFANTASGFIIYYLRGHAGWTSPSWNGYDAEPFGDLDPVDFGGGYGTEADPYIIYNIAHLVELSEKVNGGNPFTGQHFSLNVSYIDMDFTDGFTPIGTQYNYFRGTFDGNGNIIANLNVNTAGDYQGLFGYSTGTIKNIVLEHVDIIGSIGGGIAGYSSGAIQNCHVNSGSIVGETSAGGIVGDTADDAGLIEACSNKAHVTGNGARVGGIAGLAYEINGCWNTGNVSHDGSRFTLVGGVAGAADIITECYNTGTVTALNAACTATVGGVAGVANIIIESCYNKGDLKGYMFYSGGVVGQLNSSREPPAKLMNCYNRGSISTDSSDGSVGGIIGAFPRGVSLENCYSTGYLLPRNVNRNVGGIIGYWLTGGTYPNSYYLDSSSLKAVGNVQLLTPNNLSRTAEELRSFDMAAVLGDAFATDYGGVNEGFPILAWQVYDVQDIYILTLADMDPNACYIYVVDGDTKMGVPGVDVSIDDASANTDADGLATLIGITEGTSYCTLSIKAESYIDKTIPIVPMLGTILPVIIYKNTGEPRIVSARLYPMGVSSPTDVLAKMETIIVESSNRFQLAIDSVYDESVIKCEIFQRKKAVASYTGDEADSAWFDLSVNDFAPDNDIFASVTASDGKTSGMIKLQIDIVNSPGYSGYNVTLGSNIGFIIPKEIPYIGGDEAKLDLGFLPAKVLIDDKKIQIAIGVTDLFDMKKGYDGFVKNIDKASSDFENALMGNWEKGNLQGMADAQDVSLVKSFIGGIKFKHKFYAYIEGTRKDGEWQTLTGKAAFQVSWSNKKEYQMFLGPVPVVLSVAFDAKGELASGVTHDYETSVTSLLSDLKIETKLKGSFGGGVAYVVHGGVYGDLTATFTLKAAEFDSAFKLVGSFGAYAQLLFFRYDHPFIKGTIFQWPEEEASAAYAASSGAAGFETEMYDTSNYSISTRNYLAAQSLWLGERTSRGAPSGAKTLQSSVYTETEPLLAEAGGDRVMVFLADDGSRDPGNPSSLNRTKLVYSVYNRQDDTWSAPQAIWDNGAADFFPNVCSDSTDIFVAWNKSKATFANDASMEDMVAALEVAAAKFDPATKTFVGVAELTDNSTPDIRPQVAVSDGNAFVTWANLGNNDIFGTSAPNAVMYSEYTAGTWGAPRALASGLNAIADMGAGYVDGSPSIAYIIDRDNDMSTIEDRDLCVSTAFAAPIVVADDALASNPIYAYVNGRRALTWFQDGNINYTYTPGSDTAVLFEEPRASLSDGYTILSNSAGDMVVATPASDGIFGYLRDANGWGESVALLKTEGHVRYPSGLLEPDGGIYFAYNQAHVDEDEDENGISESNDLCVYRFTPSADVRLNAVYYSPGGVKAGEPLPVGIDLTNVGSKTISGFDVAVSDKAGVVDSFTLGGTLLPGDTATLDAQINIPANLEKETDYTVTVLPLDEELEDGSENSYTITLGYVDLSLDLDQYYIENDSMVIANVSNNSDFPVTDAKLLIHEDEIDGPVVKTIDIGDLGAFETAAVVALFNAEDIDFGGSDRKIIFFELASSEKEILTSNNSDFIVLAQATISEGVALTGHVRSYNPGNPTTVRLMQGGEEMYAATIPTEIGGYGQATQDFTIWGVVPGAYSLVVTKPGHTSFAVQTVVVGDEDVDLADDSRPEVRLMTLPCGDVNGDGMINSADLAVLWRSDNFNKSATQAAEPLCDLDGDGMINSADLAILWLASNFNKGMVSIP